MKTSLLVRQALSAKVENVDRDYVIAQVEKLEMKANHWWVMMIVSFAIGMMVAFTLV